MQSTNIKIQNAAFEHLPKEWQLVTIPDILLNQEGAMKIGPFGSQLKKDYFVENGFKVYGQENAFTKDFSIGNRYVDKARFNTLKSCELFAGDFIISMMGTIGKCAIVPETIEKGIMDSHLIRLQINEKKYQKELLSILIEEFPVIKQQIVNLSVGGIMQGLSTKIIRQLVIPRPEIPEQKTIIDIFDKINKSIDQTSKVINKYKSIKQGLMQDLFRYGIDEQGQIRSEKTHKFKDSSLGRIPEEWNTSSIGSSYLKGRIGWQGLTTEEYLDDGKYYLVTGTDFSNGNVSWDTCHFVEKKRYDQDTKIQLKNEDILVTKDGTIGKIAFVSNVSMPATLNSGVFVIRPLNNEYIPKYLFYVLRSFLFDKFIENLQAGSTINHLYQKDFVKFTFPLPDRKEQEKIIEVLDSIELSINNEENSLEKFKHIKSGLMQDLLTGKVRVNHLLN